MRRSLLAAAAAIVLVVPDTVRAQDVIEGQFLVSRPGRTNGEIQLMLITETARGRSTHGESMPMARLRGLSAQALDAGQRTPVQFELREEAVAPVADWRQYDTIYTERFMSTPQKNARGYDAGAPTKLAANLSERQRLFIAHGDLDDNVHFQNTTQMVDALQQARKPFAMMVYPGKNHGIAGAAARLHLFTTMTNYLRDNLVGD